jgi:hypothetical protein
MHQVAHIALRQKRLRTCLGHPAPSDTIGVRAQRNDEKVRERSGQHLGGTLATTEGHVHIHDEHGGLMIQAEADRLVGVGSSTYDDQSRVVCQEFYQRLTAGSSSATTTRRTSAASAFSSSVRSEFTVAPQRNLRMTSSHEPVWLYRSSCAMAKVCHLKGTSQTSR